jgi:hypothetical protein
MMESGHGRHQLGYVSPDWKLIPSINLVDKFDETSIFHHNLAEH